MPDILSQIEVKYSPQQKRDYHGRFSTAEGRGGRQVHRVPAAEAQHIHQWSKAAAAKAHEASSKAYESTEKASHDDKAKEHAARAKMHAHDASNSDGNNAYASEKHRDAVESHNYAHIRHMYKRGEASMRGDEDDAKAHGQAMQDHEDAANLHGQLAQASSIFNPDTDSMSPAERAFIEHQEALSRRGYKTMEAFSDVLISPISEIKSAKENDDGDFEFSGYLVLYGTPDVTPMRDKYMKSTDFDFEDGDKTTIYFHHGLDDTIKSTKLGYGNLYHKDAGIWMEGILKKRSDYLAKHVDKIKEGIKAGVFGLSSGVPAHLVERKAIPEGNEVLTWPLGKDASITHIPAEPRTMCFSLKSLLEESQETEIKSEETPEPSPENAPPAPTVSGAEIKSVITPEVVEVLADGRHVGLRFQDHPKVVLAAIKGFTNRLFDWHVDRTASRKSGEAILSTKAWDAHDQICENMEMSIGKYRNYLNENCPPGRKPKKSKIVTLGIQPLLGPKEALAFGGNPLQVEPDSGGSMKTMEEDLQRIIQEKRANFAKLRADGLVITQQIAAATVE